MGEFFLVHWDAVGILELNPTSSWPGDTDFWLFVVQKPLGEADWTRRPGRCRKGRGQHRLCDLRTGGPPPWVSLLQGDLWISAFLFLPFLTHRNQQPVSFHSAQGTVSGDSELKLGQWAVWGSANLPQLHLPADNTEAGVIHLSPSWSSLSGRTYFRRCINWSEQWREVEVV